MPLVNQSSEPDEEYFSDGLTEELIRALWRVEGLRVAGRATAWRFKHQPYDPQRAATELGVDSILEGSVRRADNRIRIHIHLVNGQDGFELWSDRFDEEYREIFAIQDRIAARVAEAFQARLSPPAPVSRPRDPEAHSAYLKGHYLVKRHTALNLKRALEYFQEASRLDPGYALPYHGASIVHVLRALMGAAPPRDALAQAEDLLNRGLALDAASAMLQNTLAMLRLFQWRWQESEKAFQRAVELEPANPHPHMMYALHRSFVGRHEEALREAHTALELDPLDPMMNFRVVQCSYYARHYRAAIRAARTAIELAPDFPSTYAYLAWALLATGATEEAWSSALTLKSQGRGEAMCEGQFGYVAGVLGRTAEARDVIGTLTARRRQDYASALPIAWTCLGLGDVNGCLTWLETAFEDHEPYLASAAVFPGYDPLRPLPRFGNLLRRLNLGRCEPVRGAAAQA